MPDDYVNIGLDLILKAVDSGSRLFSTDNVKEDFNNACNHILILVKDAFSCYTRASYGTAVFLSITAIEETAKADIGLHRRNDKSDKHDRQKDPLFNHLSKHRMAVLPTVFMGGRLAKALGEKRNNTLLSEVAQGLLRNMREEALYFSNMNGKFLTPRDVITKEQAREVILLAIETIDDRLVGLTNHTYTIDQQLNQIFDAVCDSNE